MLVINKKTKYGYINLSNTVIIASDMTLRGYKYRQKTSSLIVTIREVTLPEYLEFEIFYQSVYQLR